LILALKAYKSHLNELINKDTKALKSRQKRLTKMADMLQEDMTKE